ncbi:MAG: FAD binding domain-containing protein [Firmicutes bacterium]|nr:FAD binding domain-containing protein [Bacillota bacterium]
MIARNFAYLQPDTKEQAAAFYQEFAEPFYYGGGSEIITMCRAGDIAPDAVIDLKRIPEANVLRLEGDALVIGGCVPLRAIGDSGLFPLLKLVCGRIADHTNQCRITLGGNLCGTIQYRETALALLLADALVVLFGPGGARAVSIHEAFDERMRLLHGEFVLQARIPAQALFLPYVHVKKTAGEKIDYPLVSLSALACGDGVRVALSGLLPYPFRSRAMEDALSNRSESRERRVQNAIQCLPAMPMADYQGSAEYRQFVLRQTLAAMMEVLNL